MFAISPTDGNWFNLLKSNGFNSIVNFWTPTPWNVKSLKKGQLWYFLLKSPIRKIAGFGEFVEYKNLTIDEAWNNYGRRNGVADKTELILRTKSYAKKNSSSYQDDEMNNYTIGCVVLNNCQFWDQEYFVSLSDAEIDFKDNIVKYKIYRQFNYNLRGLINSSYGILNEPREQDKMETNKRVGQGTFKGTILKAYDNTCCISGETIPELLEAAHIQMYLSESSNHVQNGLLLRVDLHRLYDNGLLYIDENYTVKISTLIIDKFYRKFHNKKISLPAAIEDYPSLAALKLKMIDFRKKIK